MHDIAMQEPAQKESNNQRKEEQQRTGHRRSPVEKAYLDYYGILRDEQRRQA